MNEKASVQSEYDDTFKIPSVQYGESMEEQALRKEQEKTKEDMKQRQRQQLQDVQQEADKETQKMDKASKTQFETQLEQTLREKKSRQAAEIQARPDLTKEQMEAVSVLLLEYSI